MNLPPPPPPPPSGRESHSQPRRTWPTPLKGIGTWIGVFLLVGLIDGVVTALSGIDIADGLGFTLALVFATVATVRVVRRKK